jgi:hypothetical protein
MHNRLSRWVDALEKGLPVPAQRLAFSRRLLPVFEARTPHWPPFSTASVMSRRGPRQNPSPKNAHVAAGRSYPLSANNAHSDDRLKGQLSYLHQMPALNICSRLCSSDRTHSASLSPRLAPKYRQCRRRWLPVPIPCRPARSPSGRSPM